MKSLLITLATFTLVGLFDLDTAQAQNPRNNRANASASNNYNPLMPNLGVPYTNMNMARSMIYRGNNRGRSRNRGRSSYNGSMNNFFNNGGSYAPF